MQTWTSPIGLQNFQQTNGLFYEWSHCTTADYLSFCKSPHPPGIPRFKWKDFNNKAVWSQIVWLRTIQANWKNWGVHSAISLWTCLDQTWDGPGWGHRSGV